MRQYKEIHALAKKALYSNMFQFLFQQKSPELRAEPDRE